MSHQQKLMLTWSDDLKRSTVARAFRFSDFADSIATTIVFHYQSIEALSSVSVARFCGTATLHVAIAVIDTVEQVIFEASNPVKDETEC
jgi:hypothetical protein